MFDNIYVAQSLIEKAVEGTDVALEHFEDYYNFQSKDLDKCLTNFYIQADGSFVWEFQEYEYNPLASEPEGGRYIWKFSTQRVGDPQMIVDTRTTYIDFYDSYATDNERLFITFTAHVKDGKLVEPITLKSVERTDIHKERDEAKKRREQWDKTENTWQYQLAVFISEVRWKITRLLYPLNKRLDTLEKNLRDQAKQRNGIL